MNIFDERDNTGVLAKKILPAWARGMGITIDIPASELIILHANMVKKANSRTSLTGKTSLYEIVRKHSLDSLSAVPYITGCRGASMLDIGSGAGFPGIVLHAAAPGMKTVLIESSRKKCEFLEEARLSLALENVSVLNTRAESAAQNISCRERFDVVVCRAVAKMAVIAEYALPFLREGGVFLAYKGPGAQKELIMGHAALTKLGGEVEGCFESVLPGIGEKRTLIMVRKTSSTPAGYPRREGIPEKRPISG